MRPLDATRGFEDEVALYMNAARAEEAYINTKVRKDKMKKVEDVNKESVKSHKPYVDLTEEELEEFNRNYQHGSL